MSALLGVSISLLSVPILTYSIYALAVIFHKPKKTSISNVKLENVSIVIPARNEAKVMEMRIKNIATLNYPKSKIEVILVDDESTDGTGRIAEKILSKYKIKHTIIRNRVRKGTNYNYNLGVKHAKNKYVITTDADVVFEKNAIRYLLAALKNSKVGAVNGELLPVVDKKCMASSTEVPYRDVYGKICSWESSLESSYCFNGPLIMLKKSAFKGIPEKSGASDASAALNVLQNGYRTVYVPEAKFSELIAGDLSSQRRQKVRRATRLLEAGWNNKNLLFNGTKFGNIVFPLRFVMLYIAPMTLFFGILTLLISTLLINSYVGLLFAGGLTTIFLVGKIRSNLVSSWFWHNLYLLEGLLKMYKGNHLWKSIARKEI